MFQQHRLFTQHHLYEPFYIDGTLLQMGWEDTGYYKFYDDNPESLVRYAKEDGAGLRQIMRMKADLRGFWENHQVLIKNRIGFHKINSAIYLEVNQMVN